MSWPMTCLGEVASLERKSLLPEEIETGTSYLGLEHIESGGRILGYQRVGAGELQSNKFMFDPGTLLYGKLRPYLAKICIPDREGCCSTDILPIRPSQKLDISYLKHVLLWKPYVDKANSLCSGANLPRISPSSLLGIEIPLPPLEEQRRIAAILDKCSAIQAADRERRETLGRFQASYFHHLFGEPSAVSDNWPLKTVESCSTAIQTGPFGSLLHQSDYIQGGIPILNPKHIANGVIACGENETIGRDKAGEMILYQLEKGDVLLARRGEMGRCAVVTSKEDGWLCGTGSMFIRPLGGTLAPEYLCALLSSQYMRSRLEKIAIGITLLNLNANIVGDLLIPVPPIALQHRYAAVLARLSALGDLTTRSALARSTATASIQNKLLTAAGS
jgi:type I restriction enzyme S subunit